jgi:thiol-disulfide isomerase/thioredoxin
MPFRNRDYITVVFWSNPVVKVRNLILAGGIVYLQIAVFAACASAASIDLSAIQWVTRNPPGSEELNGNVCVVEFWATWCPPCRDQIPHIKTLAKKYADRNVVFIGLSADQSIGDVRAFVEKKKINYHIGMDSGIGERLGVSGIPMAFIINHEGKIVWSGHPANSRFEDAIDSAVRAAPMPILAGVEMGPFSHLRIKLCGGKNFAKAYTEVETTAQKTNSPDRIVASTIIRTVNEKLRKKIAAAKQVKASNPQAALPIYKEIVDNFGGIRLTKEIEQTYRQLRQEVAMRMLPASAQAKAG